MRRQPEIASFLPFAQGWTLVPSNTEITVAQLGRLVGLSPTARRRSHANAEIWGPALAGRSVVVVCQKGHRLSQGVAAWLRLQGVTAETLEGGFAAWRNGGGVLFSEAALPLRDAAGRTVWVTRARPKVDRIACPG